MTTRTVDVAIIGSGVLALATAVELLERGLRIEVIGPRDGEYVGQASRASGAMLTVVSEAKPGEDPARTDLEVGLRAEARAGYGNWLAQLRDLSHVKRLDLVPGLWMVGGPGDAEALSAVAAAAARAGLRAERRGPDEVPGVDSERVTQALYLADEGSVDSGDLMEALSRSVLVNQRAHWRADRAISLTDSPDGILINCDGPILRAEQVVLANGVGIGPLLAASDVGDLGLPQITSGRGVSMLVRPTLPVPVAVRTGHAAGAWAVPRADKLVCVGGTDRPAAKRELIAAPMLDEITHVAGVTSDWLQDSLRDAEVVAVRVGHRPRTPDGLPLIGRTANSRILVATGTYRTGMVLAPLLGSAMADELTTPGALADHPYSTRRIGIETAAPAAVAAS